MLLKFGSTETFPTDMLLPVTKTDGKHRWWFSWKL